MVSCDGYIFGISGTIYHCWLQLGIVMLQTQNGRKCMLKVSKTASYLFLVMKTKNLLEYSYTKSSICLCDSKCPTGEN